MNHFNVTIMLYYTLGYSILTQIYLLLTNGFYINDFDYQ